MKFSSFLIKTVVFLLFLSTLCSCSYFYKNKIILKIDSKEWTGKEFASLLAKKINTFNSTNIYQDPQSLKKIKEQLIVDLLMEYLIQKWAKNNSVFISEKELEEALKKIKKSFPSEEIFTLYLKRKGTTEPIWKVAIKQKLLTRKVQKKIGHEVPHPTKEEIQDYYLANQNLFKQKASLLIHHVFSKQKALLLQVHKQAKKKGNFIEQAQKLLPADKISQRIRVKKGSLKIFDQAFKLKVQEISPVWRSPYGFHIIQVLEKKSLKKLNFETAQKQIKNQLLVQKQRAVFVKWLDQASKRIKILKNEEAIDKIKVRFL